MFFDPIEPMQLPQSMLKSFKATIHEFFGLISNINAAPCNLICLIAHVPWLMAAAAASGVI